MMSATLKLLRPRQWIKNAFVIAPIFFARRFESGDAWVLTLSITAAFALMASSIYIFNDLYDREEDRLHPLKATRPLASGMVSVPYAILVSLICMGLSCLLLATLPMACGWVLALYLGSNLLYTIWLKHRALLDVFFIAACFVLRVLAGCFALAVMVSPWIILTTFLLALFLGFGKRYHELGFAGYAAHKQNLQHYSRELLDKLVVISAASALVCYAIYAAEMARILGDVNIVYTVVFVAFGLFRYLQSIYVYGLGGEPESVILKDKWQWLNILLWLGLTLLILSDR